VRDEGVSHHYLSPTVEVAASTALADAVADELLERKATFHRGPTWTIDAPYRETVGEARHYRDAGVLTVEMEAAALFAVAAVREVQAAAVFVASDTLADLTWVPHFDAPEVEVGLDLAFDAALAALDHASGPPA